jgi:hypothetical protein
MRKSLLYTLFKLGRVPPKALPALESEGIVLLDEGLRAFVALRNFRAPGRYHNYKNSVFAGSLVLTEQRFAGFAFSKPVINVGLHDDRLRALEISVPRDGVLSVRFDPSVFDLQSSGSVEFRYRTEKALSFLEHVGASPEAEREYQP